MKVYEFTFKKLQLSAKNDMDAKKEMVQYLKECVGDIMKTMEVIREDVPE